MGVSAAVALGTAALGYQVYSGQKQQKQQKKHNMKKRGIF